MIIKHIIWICFFATFLFACSGESHPEKVDVTVEPENSINPKRAEQEVEMLEDPAPIEKGSSKEFSGFIKHYSEVYDTVINTSSLLLDRFTSEKSFKKSIKRKQEVFMRDSSMSVPVAHLWHYEYRDSAQLGNVLRNWFLEFGNNRSEIKPGINQKVASEAGVFIINEFSIDVIYVDCGYYDSFSWNDKTQSYRSSIVKENSTVFRVDCDGELIWEKFSLPEEEVEETEADNNTDEDVGEDQAP